VNFFRRSNHCALTIILEIKEKLPQQQHIQSNNSEPLRILESLQLPEMLHGLVAVKSSQIEPERLAHVFNRIFDLYKKDFETHSFAVVQSAGFKNCCSILKSHAPRMLVNDLVTVLKVLVSLKINAHNKLLQQLLYHIKEEINELSLSQLSFTFFLLDKMEKTPLVSALIIAIPIVFDMNISMQLDHENPDELSKLLKNVTTSNMNLKEKSITSILTALILHGTSINFECAYQILWSLTAQNARFLEGNEMVEKLVRNCIHVLLNTKFDQENFAKIEVALDKLVKKYKHTSLSHFYNENLFNKCANHVIQNDLGFSLAYHILRRFSEINYVNYDLLHYVDRQIIQNHTHLSTLKIGPLMTLISYWSTANFKSMNWEILKSILHENPVLHGEVSSKWALLKFVAELLSLDFVSKIFFDKVLAERFLTEHLQHNSLNNFANFPQLRLINQTLTLLHPEYDGILPDKMLMDVANDAIPTETLSNHRLTQLLETIYGKDTVQTNVRTKHGHMLEYVISFDTQQKAVTMPCKVKYFEDLPKSHVTSIALFFHERKNSPINYPIKLRGILALRKRTIEAIGIKEVDFALHCLELLSNVEKQCYIEREVQLMLEN
jgi:hypothetical protein